MVSAEKFGDMPASGVSGGADSVREWLKYVVFSLPPDTVISKQISVYTLEITSFQCTGVSLGYPLYSNVFSTLYYSFITLYR